jgi:hypothetical protein
VEIPGHLFGLCIGLVNQSTLASVGSTVSYKMRGADAAGSATRVGTGHNMNRGADSAIPGLKKRVIRVRGMVDDTANLIDLNFALFEGLFIRMAATYLASAGAGTGLVLSSDPCFLFPGCLILGSTWSPDSEQGQPIDLEVETVLPYSTPGETPVSFTF